MQLTGSTLAGPVLGDAESGIQASTAPDVLELLAGVVVGRRLPLRNRPARAHTDGATIFISADDVPDMPVATCSVICQAALIAGGSLDHDLMRRLSRSRAGVAQRYLMLEVVRATHLLDEIVPSSFRTALSPYADQVQLSGSAEESLEIALGSAHVPAAPEWFGELRPRDVLRQKDARPAAEPGEPVVLEALHRASEPDPDSSEQGEDRSAGSKLADLLSGPGPNPLRAVLRRMTGGKTAKPGRGSAGEMSSGTRRQTGGPAGITPRASVGVVDVGGQRMRGHTYPEWDHHRRRYREAWCSVGEFDPTPSDVSGSFATSAHGGLLRSLARLGLTHRPRSHEPMGDDLDLNALVEHQVRLTSGMAQHPMVFRAERRTHRELGVLVLLDATGSTADRAGASSVFEAQRQLALDLTTALDCLGVRVALQAFYSRGRSNVRFLRCKSFDERWGLQAQRRLLGVTPGGFTRLGAALRHGAHLLDAQAGTERRLLLMVGDGIPYDDGYEGPYALEDSRRAVEEACTLAVACVGLSAVPTPEGASIWPEHAHRVVPDTSALTRVACDLFGTNLHRAAQRSTSARPTQEPSCR